MRYNSGHVLKGITYEQHLQRPKLPADITEVVIAIDTGFVDPTLINILGKDKKGIWRTYIRYRLTRIDFNEQEKIIHWLASFYGGIITIDLGPGGGAPGIVHNLINREEYKAAKYNQRLQGFNFSERILSGYDDDGNELYQDTKSYAANELANIVQDGRLVFSEVDQEGISQLERIAKQKSTTGKDRYFVLSDRGAGVDDDDHIFASYICFVLAIRNSVSVGNKKLGMPKGIQQKHNIQ